MSHLLLFCLSTLSAFIWILNAETLCIYISITNKPNPFLLAVACSIGQSISYSILFSFGDFFLKKWKAIAKRVETARVLLKNKSEKGHTLIIASAGLIGAPPLSIISPIAAGFNVSLKKFIILIVPMRFLRFLFCSLLAIELAKYIDLNEAKELLGTFY